MKAFISWSGGKDCMFALHTFLKESQNQACYLVNFCESNNLKAKSHRIDRNLLLAQSEAIGIPLVQEPITAKGYEFHLKKIISNLKSEGIQAGVFGDIYLLEHRTWIERVCKEMNILPIFPLWGKGTTTILNEFIDSGFKTLIISVQNKEKLKPLLGQVINEKIIHEITQLEDIDPCGENGEYHSFVFGGPLFKQEVEVKQGETYITTKNRILSIHLQNQY